MSEDEKGSSPKPDPVDIEAKEDAETRAARRELKQSSISDAPQPSDAAAAASDKTTNDERPDTPADEAENDDLKEQVGSPKKKRAHDQLESGTKGTREEDAASDASVDSAKDRTSRSEPEKKRHRDGELADAKSTTDTAAAPSSSTTAASEKSKETTPSAFAASGFSKLATGTSPFASLGAGQPSAFGSSAAPKLSSFASPPPDTPHHTPISPGPATKSSAPTAPAAPKLSFGGTAGASPFAGLSGTKSNGFGGGFGGGATGFGSALGGPKLSGFAAPGTISLPVGKAAKPFGAPDSDAEDDEKEDEAEGDGDATSEAERALSPETDEKKRLKLQKVEVDAGEKNEATVISVRAKMFCHDKDAGWKERGAGMLKVNAPASCVDFDDDGNPIAGSFDASGLDEEDEEGGDGGNKVVRLLMRQDQTHRVILNTVVVPAMKFQEKATLKSVSVLFTAFEGEESKPVSVTMRMSAANAKLFLNEIESIQRELSNR
ncbi:ranBP1 domain-containing protein [Sarocladium implicatum]|nr:ranBP1 domain-containing protein [Sarocladium implicatum]